MTLALGGMRIVPEPDAIAHDYLRLALRLDQHIPGLVDGYFGPAELKAAVDLEPLPTVARLRDDADALRDRLAHEIAEDDRRHWLDAQVVALRTQAAALAGDQLPYTEHVRRCFAWSPVRRDETTFEAAATDLAMLVPGDGALVERLAAWDARFTIPPDALPPVVDWLVQRFRERASTLFGIPDGERLTVSYVRGQPWSGYNWYVGGLRSRVDINLDLPVRAGDLVQTVAHETFPGHHLEHAWKETELVDRRRRLEASILLINTPESLVSEGLANAGVSFVAGADEREDLLLEVVRRAGLVLASDPGAVRDAVRTDVEVAERRRHLSPVMGNVALLRHAEGATHHEALAYAARYGLLPPDRAAKRLEFVEHPLWRTYVFVYDEGEALIRAWLDRVPEPQRAARFGRLLREPLTPPAIARESAA